MTVFLNSYRPLVGYASGRRAIVKHNLPPFIDYSCRREPDFTNPYPAISALCRVKQFVPRVHCGDSVVYMTCKDRYVGSNVPHHRLTAILTVRERFESHADAAAWYRARGVSLPINCMVAGNLPLPIDMTAEAPDYKTDINQWNQEYQRRANLCGVFLACTAQFLELHRPPIITDAMLSEAFGRIPGTQNPPAIPSDALDRLKQLCSI